MRFAPTDDQLELRGAVFSFLQKECPPARVREAWDDGTGVLADLWPGLAEMGVLGMLVPEGYDGMGMTEVDLAPVLEVSGRMCLPGPLVETAVAAPGLLALEGGDLAAEWLRGVATGEHVVSVVVDGFAAHGEAATLLVVRDGDEIVVVPRDEASLIAQESVDGSRHPVRFEGRRGGVVVASGADADAAWARALDRGAFATAAQLTGLSAAMVDLTVAYAGERKQFGVPIGSFQAVKHHLADAALQAAFAGPAALNAAYALAHDLPTASRDASMAKALASDAATFVARQALQCHGAIGYTVEYDLHLFMKRAWALAAAWGDASSHRARVADSVLGRA